MKKNVKPIGALVSLSLIMSACQTVGPVVTPPSAATVPPLSSSPSDALRAEIERSGGTANQAVILNLQKARFEAASLVGMLSMTGGVQLEAFEKVRTRIQPLLIGAAQSIATSSGVSQAMKAEFSEIYLGLLVEMLRGVNGNIDYYQSFFAQARIASVVMGMASTQSAEDEVAELANLFEATEVVEEYVARLGTFGTLVSLSETQATLQAIRNQQNTLIANAIDFAKSGKQAAALTQKLYFAVVKSISSVAILPEVLALASTLFGSQNVAVIQTEVTPQSPYPFEISAVIRESKTSYRIIQGSQSGSISNKVQQDTRGLSASDYLNQTVVVRASR